MPLSKYFIHDREVLSLNPEFLWKKAQFEDLLTLYPIRDHHHMDIIHAFSQAREITHNQNKASEIRTKLVNISLCQDSPEMSYAATPRKYTYEYLLANCNFLPQGYIPEMRRKVQNWEIVTGRTIFNSFNLSPQRLVHGRLSKELKYVTNAAVSVVKKEVPDADLHNVVNKYVRYRGTVGREFIFDIELNGSRGLVERRVALLLPHLKEQVLNNPLSPGNRTLINFIIPLDGLIRKKVAKLQRSFYTICVRKVENCRLIYVIFSRAKSDVKFLQSYLSRFKRRHSKFVYDYIVSEEKFNRTKAYALAMSKLNDDDLAFIGSIDVSLADHFLNRCRAHTLRGTQVYYPELFMYYNMPYVYRGRWHPRNYDYTRLHGRWATHAVMCIYKSDYINLGGYPTFKQWELEPSLLQAPIKGSLKVMRAPDPGISHWYEATKCDSKLPPEQFSRCLSMRSDNLADRLSLAGYLLSLENKCGDDHKKSQES